VKGGDHSETKKYTTKMNENIEMRVFPERDKSFETQNSPKDREITPKGGKPGVVICFFCSMVHSFLGQE